MIKKIFLIFFILSFAIASFAKGNDSDTKLLLHCDGADESTTFTDVSPSEHNVTANGTARVDTTNKKWGTGSLEVDGDSDYLQVPDSADFDVFASTSDDWTIDFWVKHTDHAGAEVYINQYEDGNNQWHITHTDAGGGLYINYKQGGNTRIDTAPTAEIEDTNWHHIAMCKVADEFGLYKDGTQIVYSGSFTNIDTIDGDLYIGAGGAGVSYFDGYMDEIRIQHSNIFGAAPNATPDDTIKVPPVPYSYFQEQIIVTD